MQLIVQVQVVPLYQQHQHNKKKHILIKLTKANKADIAI